MIQLIWTPWKQHLLRLVAGATKSVDLAVAYIERKIMCDVIDALPKGVQLRVLARQNASDFRSGAANLTTFDLLASLGPGARVLKSLHAKLIVVDQRIAVLGSSNLTTKGLEENEEAGLYTDEPRLLLEICRHYDDWWGRARQIDLPRLSNLVAQLPGDGKDSSDIERAINRLAEAVPPGAGWPGTTTGARGRQAEYNRLLDTFGARTKPLRECMDYLLNLGYSENQAKNAIHVYRKGGTTHSTFRLSRTERDRLLDAFGATARHPRECVDYLMSRGCTYRQATSAVYAYRKERGLIGEDRLALG